MFKKDRIFEKKDKPLTGLDAFIEKLNSKIISRFGKNSTQNISFENKLGITTIIFDFEGVLSISNPSLIKDKYKPILTNPAFESRLLASPATYKCMMGKISYDEYLKEFAKLSGVDIEIADDINKHLMDIKSISGEMSSLVKTIKNAGINLVLYSDDMKVPFDRYIRNLSLKEYFDYQICSAHIGSLKSTKMSYEKLCKYLRTTPSKCLFIDDSPANIYTAKNLGFNTIQFNNIDQLKIELAKIGFDIFSKDNK